MQNFIGMEKVNAFYNFQTKVTNVIFSQKTIADGHMEVRIAKLKNKISKLKKLYKSLNADRDSGRIMSFSLTIFLLLRLRRIFIYRKIRLYNILEHSFWLIFFMATSFSFWSFASIDWSIAAHTIP